MQLIFFYYCQPVALNLSWRCATRCPLRRWGHSAWAGGTPGGAPARWIAPAGRWTGSASHARSPLKTSWWATACRTYAASSAPCPRHFCKQSTVTSKLQKQNYRKRICVGALKGRIASPDLLMDPEFSSRIQTILPGSRSCSWSKSWSFLFECQLSSWVSSSVVDPCLFGTDLDPRHWLTDPDSESDPAPDPAFFLSGRHEANKK